MNREVVAVEPAVCSLDHEVVGEGVAAVEHLPAAYGGQIEKEEADEDAHLEPELPGQLSHSPLDHDVVDVVAEDDHLPNEMLEHWSASPAGRGDEAALAHPLEENLSVDQKWDF